MNFLLDGVRVLDFGRYIAGPYCAAMLGHLGADVIRIERPEGGEDRFLAPVTEQGDGAMFMQMNANKRGMTLDLTQAGSAEIVRRLVESADIVIANLPDNILSKFGLDYATLKSFKQDIILVSNSAFGNKGPFANRLGFDGIAQAMSGAAWYSGLPNQPSKSVILFVDYASALSATIGTMAALMQRANTGEGQVVTTSLLATGLSLNNGSLIEQAALNINRQPTGNRAQIAAPADLFATRDGHIIIQVVGPWMFKRVAKLIGAEEWLTDERFATDIGRGDHADELCERVAVWCLERTTEQALAELERARIPTGPVLSFDDALHHPAVDATDQLRQRDYPGALGPLPVATAPFQLSDSNVDPGGRAPLLGEHTNEILAEVGFSAETINQFRQNQII